MVIVEDDLLFSPDFLEYLEANAPVLERDPTTFVLSAWNDNGYKGRVRPLLAVQHGLPLGGAKGVQVKRGLNRATHAPWCTCGLVRAIVARVQALRGPARQR